MKRAFRTTATWFHSLPNSIKLLFGFLLVAVLGICCLLYTSPSPRDKRQSRMPSSA